MFYIKMGCESEKALTIFCIICRVIVFVIVGLPNGSTCMEDVRLKE